MLETPKCYLRGCSHFTGFGFDGSSVEDDTEATERPVCRAFPSGIPEDIAYGDNLHLTPVSGDGGTVFKKDEQDAIAIAKEVGADRHQ